MQPAVQRLLAGLVRRGAIRTEDAAVCAREASSTGENPLAIAVRRGLISRDDAARELAVTSDDHTATRDMRGPPPTPLPAIPTPSPVSGSQRFIKPATGGTARLAPGAPGKVFGPYELVRALGEGGMGVVYEALDTRLGRRVALKLLHGDRLLSKSTLSRFEQEARAAAKLKHPNVCPVFEVGNLNGVPYYTMELVPGMSVAALATAGVHWRRVCEVIRDAARGLQHAHDQQIVHRDVKPSNILVDDAGRGRLVDFGLAADTGMDERPDRLTRTGQFMGTPYYIAPECVEKGSKTASPLSDVYSLGVTLYEAISGELPFKATTTFQLFQDVLGGDPKPPRLPQGTPPDVSVVILRAMARDPARRYPSADALAEDLERVLRAQPIVGRPATLPELARTIARRPHFIPGVAAGVAVAALLVVVYARFVAPAPAVVAGPSTPAAAPPPAPVVAGTPPASPTPGVPLASGAAASSEALAKARAALWTGDVEKARIAYRRAFELDPKCADARLEEILAATFVYDYAAGHEAQAVALARKDGALAFVVAESGLVPGLSADAQGTSSEDVEVDVGDSPVAGLIRAARARRFIDLAEEREESAELVKRAEALVRDALRERPRCGLFATVLAEALIHSESPQKALDLLEEDRDYEGAAASMRWYVKGLALLALDRPIDAEAVLKRATVPAYAVFARSARAQAWYRKRDWAAVVSVHEGHEPSSVNDGLHHARCLLALERPADARKALDTAIELAEGGGDALALFRATKRSREDCTRALAVRGHPETMIVGAAEARGLRARLAARAGDTTSATADAVKMRDAQGLEALEKSGYDVTPLRKLRRAEECATRVAIALAENDVNNARRFFAAAVEDAPENIPADAHLDAARILAATGELEAALAACQRAASSDPTLDAAAKKLMAELRRRR